MPIKDTDIDQERIKSIIQSRLSKTSKEVKEGFPEVLKRDPVYWATICEPEYLMIVFLTSDDQKRLDRAMSLSQNPFVGLITTSVGPAAFRVEKAKYMTISGCQVTNSFTFSLGRDSTVILENHQQSVETKDMGPVSYTVPLAYILSYGDDINSVTVYDYLDGLIAFSESNWRKASAGKR